MKILDCTLRDGGYVNDWGFLQSQISKIIDSLEASRVDIIELGYLDDRKGADKNTTLFDSVASVESVLSKSNKQKTKVVMINLFDFNLDKLPPRSKTRIDGIRLVFHKRDVGDALLSAEKIIDLGYQLFFQPMVTTTYTDHDFLSLIESVNQLDVYVFYIVDSFGSMSLAKFRHYVDLANHNLSDGVRLGYHSHNNMQLAFSNAIDLCGRHLGRGVIIDASIYGMGRGAGNLNTELIADYLNKQVGKTYNIFPLLEVIDEVLTYYFKRQPWGFSPAQYLSASLNCHPNYASYLVDKKTTHITDIQEILEKIPLNNRILFDERVVDDLCQKFLLKNKSKAQGVMGISAGKQVLLIASGYSVIDNLDLIKQKVESGNYFVIALNHNPQFDCDYYFFSNQQRFDEFKNKIPLEKQVVTTNISCKEAGAVIELKDIVHIGELFITNVAILMINYLISNKVESVEIAGLDGYETGKNNYAYDETSVIVNEDLFKELNKSIKDALLYLKDYIDIKLITPSIYGKSIPLRILGVIPARYNSSRFQGKPLCLINNVPMIKRTYDRVKKSKLLDKLVVATDDLRIKKYCEKENIPVVMTSDKHLTGTDRLAEVAQKEHFDFYINIQGDEPVIDCHSINQIVDDYKKNSDFYAIYNLYKKIISKDEVDSNTIIKVVVNQNDELMYMSRHPIPFNKSTNEVVYKKQVCVYGFAKKALEVFSNRDKSHNEQFEDIELLRFLDLGYPVKMLETALDSIAVDVPEDIKKVEEFLKKNNLP